ncbi:MAG: DUF456 domain-containing protein [Bacteroidales bacterium]|nr:DUF456 domain-containing protein [Bacteroidales bacterium]MDD3860215.1 DUF456 domain-containing protein [Bacteroidales bacterium]
MDITLLIIGLVFIIAGLIGCILPVIPGPPLSYIGLLLLHFTTKADITTFTLILTAILAIVATVLDYIVPVWGTKKAGGSKWGTRGSGLGLIVGLFFSPIGIFVGPFIGALVGELLFHYHHKKDNSDNAKFEKSLKAALGSFLGLMFGVVLKIIVSCFIAFIFIKEAIIGFF